MGNFSVAEVSEPILRQLGDILKVEELEPIPGAVAVRHLAGDSGLPVLDQTGDVGFALDLTDARRTIDGGLLLFVDDTGRATGWRAEAGALTIWTGEAPILTEVAPGAPERITLFGRAQRR